MYFEVVGKITDIQRIAVGVSIRELANSENNLSRDAGES